jgi:hypothetical protein
MLVSRLNWLKNLEGDGTWSKQQNVFERGQQACNFYFFTFVLVYILYFEVVAFSISLPVGRQICHGLLLVLKPLRGDDGDVVASIPK